MGWLACVQLCQSLAELSVLTHPPTVQAADLGCTEGGSFTPSKTGTNGGCSGGSSLESVLLYVCPMLVRNGDTQARIRSAVRARDRSLLQLRLAAMQRLRTAPRSI